MANYISTFLTPEFDTKLKLIIGNTPYNTISRKLNEYESKLTDGGVTPTTMEKLELLGKQYTPIKDIDTFFEFIIKYFKLIDASNYVQYVQGLKNDYIDTLPEAVEDKIIEPKKKLLTDEEDDLEEINATSGVAGYNTPFAFGKTSQKAVTAGGMTPVKYNKKNIKTYDVMNSKGKLKEGLSHYDILGGTRPAGGDEIINKVVIPNLGPKFDTYVQFRDKEYNTKIKEIGDALKTWKGIYLGPGSHIQSQAQISPDKTMIKASIFEPSITHGIIGALYIKSSKSKRLKEEVELTFKKIDSDTGNLIYKGSDGKIYTDVEGTIHTTTQQGEPDYPVHNVKIKSGEPAYDKNDRFARKLDKKMKNNVTESTDNKTYTYTTTGGSKIYLKKIDSTHFSASNTESRPGMAYHIDEWFDRNDPNYKKVKAWLGGNYDIEKIDDKKRMESKKLNIIQIIKETITEILKEHNVKGKSFYTMDNIGKSKYSVNYYDGIEKHKDGGPFFGIRLFNNKTEYNKFIDKLKNEGYKEISSFDIFN